MPVVIAFRRFRNTDPPALADVWNESHPSRSAYPLRTPALLERWIFSKPYFDPEGLIVAYDDDDGAVLGYVLAGFGPNAELSGLDHSNGVICSMAVRPGQRRRGLGRQLVQKAEEYLTSRGSTVLRAGPRWPYCPFGFGIYGGTNCAGFLASDSTADPFFRSLGYEPEATTLVFNKKLDAPLSVTDGRFGLLRRRYDTLVMRPAAVPTWWHECVWGTLEPVEFRMVDKLANNFLAARAIVWELEGYGWRWGYPAAGVLDIQVREDLRRQGLAKLLLTQILRFLQDQFFGICELHAPAESPALVGLCRSVSMEQVDTGTSYVKRLVPSPVTRVAPSAPSATPAADGSEPAAAASTSAEVEAPSRPDPAATSPDPTRDPS